MKAPRREDYSREVKGTDSGAPQTWDWNQPAGWGTGILHKPALSWSPLFLETTHFQSAKMEMRLDRSCRAFIFKSVHKKDNYEDHVKK